MDYPNIKEVIQSRAALLWSALQELPPSYEPDEEEQVLISRLLELLDRILTNEDESPGPDPSDLPGTFLGGG